jgi:hypothetical protein
VNESRALPGLLFPSLRSKVEPNDITLVGRRRHHSSQLADSPQSVSEWSDSGVTRASISASEYSISGGDTGRRTRVPETCCRSSSLPSRRPRPLATALGIRTPRTHPARFRAHQISSAGHPAFHDWRDSARAASRTRKNLQSQTRHHCIQ